MPQDIQIHQVSPAPSSHAQLFDAQNTWFYHAISSNGGSGLPVVQITFLMAHTGAALAKDLGKIS